MTLLSASAVSVSLGGVGVLAGVDMAIAAGEFVGLIGPNGAGKTTLLRVCAGLLRPDAGTVRLAGQSLQRMGARVLGRTLSYLPQGGDIHWQLSVEAVVGLGRLPHRSGRIGLSDADRQAVDRALAACDVVSLRHRSATQLSGGERRRVLLARALAGEPKLLLADEPVAGLDPGHQLDVMARLRSLAADGTGVVAVLHDLTLAARFCDRLVLLHEGRVAAAGGAEAVLSADHLARCYGIRAHRGTAGGHVVIVPIERTSSGTADARA